jgi:SynChlorMet cassette radical SAM/SPASM protein ScmF
MSVSQSRETAHQYPLRYIYFYLTEGCNLACRHCWIAPKYQHDKSIYAYLSIDLIKSVIEQSKPLGLTNVKLTGGEPLLHPQIADIIGFVSKEGLRLNLETNGVLCTPEIARVIAGSNQPFVSVSLDGIDAKTHEWVRGVPGCFEAALQGFRNLFDAGLKPQVIMTLMRRNKDQVEEMIHLAKNLGAGSVKFNILQPTARGDVLHREGEVLSIEEMETLGAWIENDLCRSSNMKIIFDHPLAFRSMSNMFGDEGSGCCTCGIKGIIGVLSDGSYALCGIGENTPELVFGHAKTDRLEDIWKGSKVLKEVRENLPGSLTGICSECIMRGFCLGRCIAQNYYRSKDLWAPFWYCEEADKAGIFPDSRRIKKS